MTLPQITWPYVFATRRETGALSAREIDETQLALSHLRSIFGEDVAGLPIPLLERLLNQAPWTYQWLTWLSDSMRRVEQMHGYTSLRERLINPTKFDEACSVLQVAERLVAADLQVSFDVTVEVDGARKVPDILVKDLATDAKFFCEVSVLYSAKGQVDQSRAVDQIAKVLLFQENEHIAFSGRLLRPFDKDKVDGLIKRIQWEMWEAEKEDSFREVTLDDVLLLALGPKRCTNQVAAWARQCGLELNAFSGLLPGVNSITRLRWKIEEKAKQLPPGLPNLLVIPAQDLFIDVNAPLELLALAVETISHCDKVAALVLTSEDFGVVIPQSTKLDEHVVAISDRDGAHHQNVIAKNPGCLTPIPSSTLRKIHVAFSL